MSTVISIENIWKEYRLGVIGHGTLTKDLQSWWARVRGKEDPNRRLDELMKLQDSQVEGDHFWALRNIYLDVKDGELLGIIGRNGAGKSTLLKILSRVTAPTLGNIKVKGRIASLLEVGTGFHPELTGRENIFLNGAILGMSKQEVANKLDEIIDFSGVEKYVDTPVKRYSSGMYVRLAFAVAAHLEPEILIVDEVLAVGDAEFQEKCIGKMSDVSRSGRTVLFVSHNMASIKELCNRAVLVEKGRLTKEGMPDEIVRSYLGKGKGKQLLYQAGKEKGHPYVRRAELWQEDTEGAIFDMHRPIVIDFTVEPRGRENLVVGLYILNEEGLCIHNSSDEFSGSFAQGIFSFRRCVIPPNALARGKYTVDFALAERNVEVFDQRAGALSFQVEFTGAMSDRTTGAWKGVCGPGLLQWQYPEQNKKL